VVNIELYTSKQNVGGWHLVLVPCPPLRSPCTRSSITWTCCFVWCYARLSWSPTEQKYLLLCIHSLFQETQVGTDSSHVVDGQQNKSRETSEKGQLTDAISTEHRGTITSRNKQLTASDYAFFTLL